MLFAETESQSRECPRGWGGGAVPRRCPLYLCTSAAASRCRSPDTCSFRRPPWRSRWNTSTSPRPRTGTPPPAPPRWPRGGGRRRTPLHNSPNGTTQELLTTHTLFVVLVTSFRLYLYFHLEVSCVLGVFFPFSSHIKLLQPLVFWFVPIWKTQHSFEFVLSEWVRNVFPLRCPWRLWFSCSKCVGISLNTMKPFQLIRTWINMHNMRTNTMQIQARRHSNLSTITPACCSSEIKVYQTKVAIEQPVISSVFDAASVLLIKAHSGTDTHLSHNKQLWVQTSGTEWGQHAEVCTVMNLLRTLLLLLQSYVLILITDTSLLTYTAYEETLN